MDEKISEEVEATSYNKKKLCYFGKLMDEESSCFSEFTTGVNEWSEIDKWILSLRSGMLAIDSSTIICNHHITTLMTMYELHQRKCCDPFKHIKSMLWYLRIISIKFVDKANTVDINLTPGKKLCCNCERKVYQLIEQEGTTESELTENEWCWKHWRWNYSSRESMWILSCWCLTLKDSCSSKKHANIFN